MRRSGRRPAPARATITAALAVLGQPRSKTPRHAAALQHQPPCHGGRRHVPGPFGVEREEKLPDGTTRKVNLLARAPIRLGRRSRTATRNSPWPTQEARLGRGTPEERAVIERVAGGPEPEKVDKVSWSTDLSGGVQRVAMKHGCLPYGNGKARAVAWNLPDPIPVHREPIYTPRIDLISKYPTLPDAKQFRLPNIGFTVQKAAMEKGIAKQFPIILSSGRLVEYEGGGEETRSNKWLAELQQDMFVEINPGDAAERGIRDGGWVWITGAENASRAKVRALSPACQQRRRLDALPFRRLVHG